MSINVTFSIIIPTCGRPTLARTLDSIVKAGFQETDQVLVIADGEVPEAKEICSQYPYLRIFFSETGKTPDGLGAPQRAAGMRVATGTHLLFLDDDDAYVEGALSVIRNAVSKKPEKLFLFRMACHSNRFAWKTLWDVKHVYLGNVGTPMIVLPNNPAIFGVWTSGGQGSDYRFLMSTLERYPGGEAAIEWREEIVANVY